MNEMNENLPQPLDVDELRDIETRAERVSALLRKSATLWLEIASEVRDAKEQLSADAYAIFLQKACLTPAIANKMPTIAKTPELYSDEAKKHIQKLEGWSTLYETAKLKVDERRQFFDALNRDPEIDVSRAFIQSFKKSKQNFSNTASLIAEIRFNENDIQRFDYDQFLDLKEKLDDIARIIDRMSPVVAFSLRDNQIEKIETAILNADADAVEEYDEHCDELPTVTLPIATNDCSFSEVAN